MKAVYELWHIDSGNLVGSFEVEEKAVERIRELVALNGHEIARTLELGVEFDDGAFTHLGTGAEILARVGDLIPSDSVA